VFPDLEHYVRNALKADNRNRREWPKLSYLSFKIAIMRFHSTRL
jgi:hypothetical protein